MDAYVALRIGRIRRALYREFEAQVEAFCLTVPQYQVLSRLWEGDGILTSTVVTDTGSDGATVTGIVDRLEARGLIRRERGSTDRRKVYLFLTPAGQELERPLRSILLDLNEQALRGLAETDRRRLLDLLAKVEQNLAEAEENPRHADRNTEKTGCSAAEIAGAHRGR